MVETVTAPSQLPSGVIVSVLAAPEPLTIRSTMHRSCRAPQFAFLQPSMMNSGIAGSASLAATPGGMSRPLRCWKGVSYLMGRRIASNPCDGTKLPKVQRPQIVPLTTEQVEAVRAALPAALQALVTLAAGTGMRQGECFGLTVDRVRFRERALTVDRQLVAVPGHAPSLGPPKTRASHRTIPLPQVVVDALAPHLAEFSAGSDGPGVHAVGQAITRSTLGYKWRAAVKASGSRTGPGFTRYVTTTRVCIRHGESVKTVQARLGHASAVETLDTYSHLWPDSDDRTRDAIDSVLGFVADPLRTEAAPTS
jgi:integrase